MPRPMIVEPRRSANLAAQKKDKPWWNRPLIGNKSLVDRIKGLFFRQPVASEAIEFHDSIFKEISTLSKRMLILDKQKFGNKEFLAFVRINRSLQRGEGKYQDLQAPSALLRAGLTAHHSFTNLEQIEFAHRGRRFSDLYSFVDNLCIKRVRSETFCRQVTAKTTETFALLKSTEGKDALRRYILHLEKIGQHQLSLNLLYAFKRLQFRSYTIFRIVSDILNGLTRADLLNTDSLSTRIIREYDSFERLGDLIGLNTDQQNIQTYTLLFQYLAMSERHSRAYEQFIGLTDQLKTWKQLCQKLLQLRQQYPRTEFKHPKQFLAKIPGTQLYEKYGQYFEE